MREEIMTALFALLTSPPLSMAFTGTLAAGDVNVRNIVMPAGGTLVVNMPVTGEGVDQNTVIANLDPVQLSKPAVETLQTAQLNQGFIPSSCGRRLKFWADVKDQPALFLVGGDEAWAEREWTKPALINLECEAWVYSTAGADPDAVPEIVLNTFVELIDQQLQPIRFSLPPAINVVQVAWTGIEGKVVKAPGHIGGQAIAIIPIRVVFTQGVRR